MTAILILILALAGFRAQGQSGGSTAQALEAYARLSGRTVIRAEALPPLSIPLSLPLPADTNAALEVIERELAKAGMEMVRKGELFVLAVPKGWSNAPLGQQLARIEPELARKSPSPKGTMSFPGLNLEQALGTYSQICGRTVLRPAVLPPILLQLQTQSALTADEMGYALEATMALNGIAAVRDGDKFVQIVPLAQAAQAQVRAPVAEPGATLIDPGKLPVFTAFDSPRLMPKVRTPGERLTELYIAAYTSLFKHPPPPLTPLPDVDILVGVYAHLTGLTPVSSKEFGRRRIDFEARSPLTKAELCYAIETTLKLNQLKIVRVEEKSVRAGSVSERGEPEKH